MPATLPPAPIYQQLSADGVRLQGEMIESERKLWLASIKSAPPAPEPCAAPATDEIVVCAPVYDDPARDRLGPPVPDPPTAMEEFTRKLHVKLGPGQLGPANGIVGVAFTLKF
jgi:hypothetical protein